MIVAILMFLIGVAAILSATLTRQVAAVLPIPTPTPSPSPTPLPVVSAEATNSTLIDFSAGKVFVAYDKSRINTPSTFQVSPDTFVIPKTGNYRIAANIIVTETSGVATSAAYYAEVNSGQNDYVFGLEEIRANGSGSISGDVVAYLNAGDTVKMVITQFFSSSTGIGYLGVVSNAGQTYNLTNVSFQYISE